MMSITRKELVFTIYFEEDLKHLPIAQVQMRLERTTLGDITEYIESVCKSDEMFLAIKLSAQRTQLLQLEVRNAWLLSYYVHLIFRSVRHRLQGRYARRARDRSARSYR